MPKNERVLGTLLVKVNRAYEHIIDLQGRIILFRADQRSHQTFFEDDPQSGQRTYYVRILKEIPLEFSALIGDILQNLRSALDHLAWHLVQSSPVTPKAPAKDIYFPIFETAREYTTGKMRKIQGMSDAAIKAIDRLEPYYRPDGEGIGQSVPLFWLHEINKLDKHRLLIPVWEDVTSHTLPKTLRIELEETLRHSFGERWKDTMVNYNVPATEPLKNGSKLLTIPISEVDDNMAFRFQIAFGEPKWVRGKEVLSTLVNMHRIVKNILIDFDAQDLL